MANRALGDGVPELLFGEFVRKLDERHRIALPSALVESLLHESTDAVLVKERGGALSLWPAAPWRDRWRDSLDVLSTKWKSGVLGNRQATVQSLGRLLSTRHQEVAISGRSRLLIPEGFREFWGVAVGESAIVVGAAICIELWHPVAWREHLQAEIPRYSELWEQVVL